MKEGRNFDNIDRQTGIPGQNVQHFMSNSPWLGQTVCQQVQGEIAAKPGLERGGVLLLDESGDEKAGENSVGAARQYNGRMGKVDLSQVGVFLAYANVSPSLPAPVWTWVDGEVFIPEQWFTKEKAPKRERLGIPPDREFATRVELGWRMVQRAVANRLPFEVFCCDDLYGRSKWFRSELHKAGIVYMADVPTNTQVYLTADGGRADSGSWPSGAATDPPAGALGGQTRHCRRHLQFARYASPAGAGALHGAG